MPCQSENRILHLIQLIHMQKGSQLVNSASEMNFFYKKPLLVQEKLSSIFI